MNLKNLDVSQMIEYTLTTATPAHKFNRTITRLLEQDEKELIDPVRLKYHQTWSTLNSQVVGGEK